MQNTPFALWLVALGAIPSFGASYYPARPDDPKAVNLTKDNFSVRGDEGRDRIARTIFVGPGVRVFGYGATRPAILLASNTPGYQDKEAFMIFSAADAAEGAPPRLWSQVSDGGRAGRPTWSPGISLRFRSGPPASHWAARTARRCSLRRGRRSTRSGSDH